MLESGKADLSGIGEIGFVECDCTMNFPGYDVELARPTNYLRAVKNK
jgi:hypothetical protein